VASMSSAARQPPCQDTGRSEDRRPGDYMLSPERTETDEGGHVQDIPWDDEGSGNLAPVPRMEPTKWIRPRVLPSDPWCASGLEHRSLATREQWGFRWHWLRSLPGRPLAPPERRPRRQ
jgi:hypothetical protein